MSETHLKANSEMDTWLGRGMLLGVAAGALFIVFEVAAATILGPGPLGPPRMIGGILLGQGALRPLATPAFVALTGLAIHFLLSALYGGVFGAIVWIVRPLRTNRALLVGAATAFGLLLWAVNFYLISPVAFPWFGMANPVVQFVAHTFFFGGALGLLFAGRTGQMEESNHLRSDRRSLVR